MWAITLCSACPTSSGSTANAPKRVGWSRTRPAWNSLQARATSRRFPGASRNTRGVSDVIAARMPNSSIDSSCVSTSGTLTGIGVVATYCGGSTWWWTSMRCRAGPSAIG